MSATTIFANQLRRQLVFDHLIGAGPCRRRDAVASYYNAVQEDWLSFFQTAAAHADPNDLFLVLPNELEVIFAYYKRDCPAIKDVAYIPDRFPFQSPSRVNVGNFAAPRLESFDMEKVTVATAAHRRVWLVTRAENLYDARGMIRNYLGQSRTATEYWNDGLIRLDLFQ